MQIVMSVSWNLDMIFPEPFATIVDVLSFKNLNLINIDCEVG